MSKIIENPTADQLEAGGVIKEGTYRGIKLRDEPLHATGYEQELAIGDGNMLVRCNNGEYYVAADPVIASYGPPEPKHYPWDLPYDGWIAYDEHQYFGRITTYVQTAEWCRNAQLWRRCDGRQITNARQVVLADPATTVPVPREALDRLRKARRTYTPVGHLASATVRFLRDVDAES